MRVAVIGGGAAGMMATATLNELDPQINVFLFEKNASLGKKVIISGGGRCNVTTGLTDVKAVLKKYPRGEKFLTTTMHHFTPADVVAWFEAHGVPLKCEDDLRVFPVSDRGADVVGAFEHIFKRSKTKVLTTYTVQRIERVGETFQIYCKDQTPIEVDRVVLALGGQAYRQTGSTGDGYTLAESLGHHITPLAPSLSSFIIKEKWPRQLAGLSFPEATIAARGTKRFSFTGPFLFTHTGVSGPAVFALSSIVAFEKYGPTAPLPLTIDVHPGQTVDEVTALLKTQLRDNPKKSFKNTLHAFVPMSLAEIICQENKIAVTKKNAEITNRELTTAITWLKALPLSAIGRGAGDEFVTAGGVELSEVDPRTMESKLCPGLYFAGEILNVDGFTGGFNLQASWATGRTVAESIARVKP